MDEPIERQRLDPALGAELRAARERLGIGVREAGRRAGVSFPHVAAIERGDRAPSAAVARALVVALRLASDTAARLIRAGERVDAGRRERAERYGYELHERSPRPRALD